MALHSTRNWRVSVCACNTIDACMKSTAWQHDKFFHNTEYKYWYNYNNKFERSALDLIQQSNRNHTHIIWVCSIEGIRRKKRKKKTQRGSNLDSLTIYNGRQTTRKKTNINRREAYSLHYQCLRAPHSAKYIRNKQHNKQQQNIYIFPY